MNVKILIYFFLFTSFISNAQTIKGKISDINNIPLPAVNISIIDLKGGITSNNNGFYSISIKPNRSHVVAYSFVGYQTEKVRIPMLKKGQEYILNIILKESNTLLDDIIVKDQKESEKTSNYIRSNSTLRYYGIGAQIIKELKIKNMILVTRSKKKIIGLDGFGIKITRQEIIKWNIKHL